MHRCAIPFCRKRIHDEDKFCQECLAAGLDEDYQKYQDLMDEGYPEYKARLMSGLDDPE